MTEVRHAIGGALVRKGRGALPVGLPTIPERGPVSVSDVAQFRSLGYGAPPADANYVMWRWPTGTDLYTVFNSLAANDILVLPEDPNPYVVKQMYHTSDGTVNGTNPTTDRSAARTKRGIIGLGPNAVITFSSDFPSYSAQTVSEGARESIIETWAANSYNGNYTIKGRYIGGLAFHNLKIEGPGALVERVKSVNHYGFMGHEPGETMGITFSPDKGSAACVVRKCEVDGSNQTTGLMEGTGGIHLVQGGDMTVEDCYIHDVRGVGVAHWNRGGLTTIRNTTIHRIGDDVVLGRGINVEACGLNHITVDNCDIRLSNPNGRPHFAVASIASGTTYYSTGKTQLYVNNLTHDEAAVKAWVNVSGNGTIFGFPNAATASDFHFTPSNTPVTYTGFK